MKKRMIVASLSVLITAMATANAPAGWAEDEAVDRRWGVDARNWLFAFPTDFFAPGLPDIVKPGLPPFDQTVETALDLRLQVKEEPVVEKPDPPDPIVADTQPAPNPNPNQTPDQNPNPNQP